MKKSKLEQLRRSIDAIDEKLVALLVKRSSFADEIGRTKEAEGAPVKDPAREERVLKRVRSKTRRPLSKSSVEKIYRAILKESRGMQSKRKRK